jgi:hypothetical protein
VPFNVVSSPQFCRPQDFYVASADRTVKSGPVVHPAKIRNEMLPLRYSEAIDRSRVRIDASPMCEQFTLADDGWSSRRKVHYTTITIGAPRVPPETVALCYTPTSKLHGIAIAKGGEHLILLGGRWAPLDNYRAGFGVPLPGSPSAIVSDSSGPNVRARAIASLLHPDIIFTPVCSHLRAIVWRLFDCVPPLRRHRQVTACGTLLQLVVFPVVAAAADRG